MGLKKLLRQKRVAEPSKEEPGEYTVCSDSLAEYLGCHVISCSPIPESTEKNGEGWSKLALMMLGWRRRARGRY